MPQRVMTVYETELVAYVLKELDPKHRVASLSMKTDPLSDECKRKIRALLRRRGYEIEFPIEEVRGQQQHFVRALKKMKKIG